MAADEQPAVYLVVMEQGGLFGVYLTEDRARIVAAGVKGVVAAVPIMADYRPKEGDDGR